MKPKKEKKPVVVPFFLFKARSNPEVGNFKNVYGRVIKYGEIPLTLDNQTLQKHEVENWVQLRSSASSMLHEVKKSDFDCDDYLRNVARIETRVSILTRHAMIEKDQTVLPKLSEKIHHIVRLLYLPSADREVLWSLSLEVAKLVAAIKFPNTFKEPERSMLKSSIGEAKDLAKSIETSAAALKEEQANYDKKRASKSAKTMKKLPDEAERAAEEKKKRLQHFRLKTCPWKGDPGIDDAIKVVDKGYTAWAVGFSPFSSSTGSILDALCDARAVLWQLHFKLKVLDAALLFEQMDYVSSKLEVVDISQELKKEMDAWKKSKVRELKQKKSKVTDWRSMCCHSLVHRRARMMKYLKKKLMKHAMGEMLGDLAEGMDIDIDIDIDFDIPFPDDIDLDLFEGFSDEMFSIPTGAINMPDGYGEFSLNAAEGDAPVESGPGGACEEGGIDQEGGGEEAAAEAEDAGEQEDEVQEEEQEDEEDEERKKHKKQKKEKKSCKTQGSSKLSSPKAPCADEKKAEPGNNKEDAQPVVQQTGKVQPNEVGNKENEKDAEETDKHGNQEQAREDWTQQWIDDLAKLLSFGQSPTKQEAA
eukprot:767047-Hanusia_phi.AAC.2